MPNPPAPSCLQANTNINPNLVLPLFLLGSADIKEGVDLLERPGVETGHVLLHQLGHDGLELFITITILSGMIRDTESSSRIIAVQKNT